MRLWVFSRLYVILVNVLCNMILDCKVTTTLILRLVYIFSHLVRECFCWQKIIFQLWKWVIDLRVYICKKAEKMIPEFSLLFDICGHNGFAVVKPLILTYLEKISKATDFHQIILSLSLPFMPTYKEAQKYRNS